MSTNKNHLGRNSLIISITGLIIVQALIYFGYLESKYWHILLSGFEAGTIGGFADWFAVRALFHEIPIPLVRKHTDIIVKNRKKLTEGVVDLVTNKWLSPEIIQEKIANVQIVDGLIKTLKEPENKLKVIGFLKEIVSRLASNADDPEVTGILQSLVKEQLKEFDITTPLGQWIKKSIEDGDHYQLWEIILNAGEKTINDPSTRDVLLELVEKLMNEYKCESFFKNLVVGIGGGLGALDPDSIVTKIINSLEELIRDAKADPNHSLRMKMDVNILDFANGLIAGDEKSIKTVNDIRDKLLHNGEAGKLIQGVLGYFKSSVLSQLHEDDTPVINFLNHQVDKLLSELENDEHAQHNFDLWIKATIEQLIVKYHPEIGEMVRVSLTRLNDMELVNQIEEKVGNDLQYIRLNGAVVGGCVGIVIATLRMFLL